MDKKQLEKDFIFLRDVEGVLAVLVFGSQVTGDTHERSDTDICIVAPGTESREVMRKIWSNLNTESRGYDVHTFKEMKLRIKHEVIEKHKVVWCRDNGELQEYFYKYRKIWNDQAKARGVV